MVKKIITILLSILIFSLSYTIGIFAGEHNETELMSYNNAKLLQYDDDSYYYLTDNKLLKVEIEKSEKMPMYKGLFSDKLLHRDVLDKTIELNIKFYESNSLTEDRVDELKKAKLSVLEKSDEATNPMGNIKAKLVVKYSWTKLSNPQLLRLISATSSYQRISYEGVAAKSSELHWNAEGRIYKNGKFSRQGSVGNLKKFSKPTFTNVTLMPSNTSVEPIIAGATYTLYCTRDVKISVYLQVY